MGKPSSTWCASPISAASTASTKASAGSAMAAARARRVLILVENLPSPFDRRVWQEATALRDHGFAVSIVCPTGKGYESRFEVIEDIHIHRYRLPVEASG